MIFKTHQANIGQIKGHIRAYGATWFHGDGNIYKEKEEGGVDHSQNNVTYSNPEQEEAKYRIKFTAIDQVPSTVEELNKMLMEAKNKEVLTKRAASASTINSTFEAYEEDNTEAAEKKRLADEAKEAKKAEDKLKKEAEAAEKKRLADEAKNQQQL